MCSQCAHLKRRNPSLASPHGQLDGEQDPALRQAGWGTLQPHKCMGTGRVWHLWLSLILHPHHVRASGCCGRLSQDVILMELGNRAHGGPAGVARCVLGCSPHSPTTPVREETAFIFLLRGGCGQVLFQAEQCSEGRAVCPGCRCPGWHGGAMRGHSGAMRGHSGAVRSHSGAVRGHSGAVSRRAGSRGRGGAGGARLARPRRERAAGRRPGPAVSSPLVRRGIQENNRER